MPTLSELYNRKSNTNKARNRMVYGRMINRNIIPGTLRKRVKNTRVLPHEKFYIFKVGNQYYTLNTNTYLYKSNHNGKRKTEAVAFFGNYRPRILRHA